MVARPDYVNGVQGTITQTDSPLNLAIAGQGFFAVSQQTGQIAGKPTFNPQQFYSRAGDFSLNNQGYLVNSSGQYLNGWSVNAQTGLVNQNALAPIQVTQTALNPVATSTVDLAANLPATPATGTATAATPITSDITVYDALGTPHTVTMGWSQNAASNWTVTITAKDDVGALSPNIGTASVLFGAAAAIAPPVTAGTIGQITGATGAVTPLAPFTTGSAAAMDVTMDFGSGPQTITLGLGTYGGSNGVTQYAGTTYNLQGLSQNGVPPGSYAGVTMQANGAVVVNYNNGQTRTIAQVPLVTFNAPDQRCSGKTASRSRRPPRRAIRSRSRSTPTAPAALWSVRRKAPTSISPPNFSQVDRGAAGLFGEHQSGDHGERHAAGNDQHEAVTGHES